ncbi:hypothetical protein [Bacillus sp. Hm123]|uniref:hypothetical protein n=1 Tax=Bacillus sp. Hm123 TaxID=3450745 RepID=UPI003F435600
MKKMTTVMGAVLLAGGVLAACSDTDTTKSEETPENEEVKQAADSAVEPEQNTEAETSEPVEEAEESEVTVEEVEAKGIYNGMADLHTVEINVDGEDKAFQIDPAGEEVKKFEELEEGSEVTFVYQVEGEQMTITQVKAMEPKQEVESETTEPTEPTKEPTEESTENETAAVEEVEATGIYNGMADLHTVELNVDGEDRAFQIAPDGEEVKKFEELEEGSEVTFVYKTEGEQMTITQVK